MTKAVSELINITPTLTITFEKESALQQSIEHLT